jgi:hypothetical protein
VRLIGTFAADGFAHADPASRSRQTQNDVSRGQKSTWRERTGLARLISRSANEHKDRSCSAATGNDSTIAPRTTTIYDRVHRPRNARPRQIPSVTTMPKTIQEILDHADDLAKRFEDYEPTKNDERPVAEYLLQRAALARARTERQIVEAVETARTEGTS